MVNSRAFISQLFERYPPRRFKREEWCRWRNDRVLVDPTIKLAHEGKVTCEHFTRAHEILSRLDGFFEQHVACLARNFLAPASFMIRGIGSYSRFHRGNIGDRLASIHGDTVSTKRWQRPTLGFLKGGDSSGTSRLITHPVRTLPWRRVNAPTAFARGGRGCASSSTSPSVMRNSRADTEQLVTAPWPIFI